MSGGFGMDILDLDQISLTIFGVSINEGPGVTGADEGNFIEIEQAGPDFKLKKGSMGRSVRMKTNEPETSVVVHLLKTSSKNAILSAMLNKDKSAPNGAGVGTLQIKDLQGTSFFTSQACWVSGPPKITYGPEGEGCAWPITCTLVDRLDGGN